MCGNGEDSILRFSQVPQGLGHVHIPVCVKVCSQDQKGVKGFVLWGGAGAKLPFPYLTDPDPHLLV